MEGLDEMEISQRGYDKHDYENCKKALRVFMQNSKHKIWASGDTPPQRPKNPGSRVALLPGKFLHVQKVFVRMIEMIEIIIPNSPILPC